MSERSQKLRTGAKNAMIWIVLILAIVAWVAYNRSVQTHELAALSSPNSTVRDKTTLALARSGNLMDFLASTEDPNSDSSSPQNVRSAALRQNAANSLNHLSQTGQLPDSLAMETMLQMSKDSNAGVQATAEQGLTALGVKSPANFRELLAKLSDGDPGIRGAASAVLGMIGALPGRAVQTAAQVNAQVSNLNAQSAALSALQTIGAPSVPFLWADYNAPSAGVQFQEQLINLLGTIGAVNAIPDLQIAANAGQPALRHPAYAALADIVLSTQSALATALAAKPRIPAALASAQANFAVASQAEPVLLRALSSVGADSQTRSQAALALGAIGGNQAIALLTRALSDYDTQVRDSASTSLQTIGSPAVAPLIAVLATGNEIARVEAAQALGGIGNGQAIAALTQTFNTPATSAAVRTSTAEGLGRSGSISAIPLLVKALSDPSGQVQSAASAALLNPALESAAIAPLIASFSNPSPAPFNAAETLSRMGNAPLPALLSATASSSAPVQTWAAIALGQSGIADPRAATALARLAKLSNPSVRYAAQQALDQIGNGTAG